MGKRKGLKKEVKLHGGEKKRRVTREQSSSSAEQKVRLGGISCERLLHQRQVRRKRKEIIIMIIMRNRKWEAYITLSLGEEKLRDLKDKNVKQHQTTWNKQDHHRQSSSFFDETVTRTVTRRNKYSWKVNNSAQEQEELHFDKHREQEKKISPYLKQVSAMIPSWLSILSRRFDEGTWLSLNSRKYC